MRIGLQQACGGPRGGANVTLRVTALLRHAWSNAFVVVGALRDSLSCADGGQRHRPVVGAKSPIQHGGQCQTAFGDDLHEGTFDGCFEV